ncbi:MAG: GGDEF domain-containing protein [Fibrobacteria bacterium]|nr:GGDEF domain-containing protein [Fibrobacteria bacterium]
MRKARISSKALALSREAKFLKNRVLTIELLEIFTGEREGTAKEKSKLKAITKKLQNKIYIEAVYLIAHKFVDDVAEARKIFDAIIRHRNGLVKILKRNVSVQVAALDYLQDVCNIIRQPTIIEADELEKFVYHAVFDDTTQAFEKDIMDVELEAEIEKSRRFGSIFSLFFIDLDNLKKLNDTFGHESGTEAIKSVSQFAKKNLRKYDSIFRYGGDEFVVLLPGVGIDAAHETANRIRNMISRHRPGKAKMQISVSIGVTAFDNSKISDRKSLLEAADTALYEAKQKGKNRVCTYRYKTSKDSRLSNSNPKPRNMKGVNPRKKKHQRRGVEI